MPHDARIIVVSGMPGVGKSTLARRLAESLPRAAHVEADRLQDMIVSGAVHGSVNGISHEAWEQIDLRLHHAVLLARSFCEAGFNAIIDDIITGRRVEHLIRELDGQPFSFIMLQREREVLKDEYRAIGSPFVDAFDWIDNEIRQHTPRIGLWVDTTGQQPDETCEIVRANLDAAQVSEI